MPIRLHVVNEDGNEVTEEDSERRAQTNDCQIEGCEQPAEGPLLW